GVVFVFLQLGWRIGQLLDSLDTRGTLLGAGLEIVEILKSLETLVLEIYDGDLAVHDIGLTEGDLFGTLLGDGHAVPDAVEFLGIQRVDHAVPGGWLPIDLDAEPFADFFGGID